MIIWTIFVVCLKIKLNQIFVSTDHWALLRCYICKLIFIISNLDSTQIEFNLEERLICRRNFRRLVFIRAFITEEMKKSLNEYMHERISVRTDNIRKNAIMCHQYH